MSSVDCSLYFRKILPSLQAAEPEPILQPNCCQLNEIKCDNDRITEIRIFSRSFSGQIPSEISQLQELQILHLYRNSLTGAIPPSLGMLAKVKDLSLGGNLLEGSIPPELGNLSNLEFLFLDINRLQGPIPSSLGNLKMLKILYLQNNFLEGQIPSEIKELGIRDLKYDERNSDTFTRTMTSTPTVTSSQSVGDPPIVFLSLSIVGGFLFMCLVTICVIRWAKKRDSYSQKEVENEIVLQENEQVIDRQETLVDDSLKIVCSN